MVEICHNPSPWNHGKSEPWMEQPCPGAIVRDPDGARARYSEGCGPHYRQGYQEAEKYFNLRDVEVKSRGLLLARHAKFRATATAMLVGHYY